MLPLEYSGPTLHRLEALDANRPLLFGLRQHKNYHFHPPCCTDWYMKYFAVDILIWSEEQLPALLDRADWGEFGVFDVF